ncbi:S9 family peptidase [Nevskia sp.]|uniref:alpha/beta hydrolase family protein n=1 Tax=Nevskia sp. TaxID=1929292 RepID=UPI0025E5DF50|nr:S9 family peptidase [Nevskia sp.]
MNPIARSLLVLVLNLLPAISLAEGKPPSAADFASRPDYSRLQIAPDGRHVAVITEVDDQQGLLVIRLADKAVIGRFTLGLGGAIADYWWVGPMRLVVSGAIRYGSLDEPRPIGELIGVDADGGNRSYLFGYRAPIGAIKSRGHGSRGVDLRRRLESAMVIDPLPDDPQHAVIAVQTYAGGGELGKASAVLLDVYSGARTTLKAAAIAGPSSFLTDQNGTVRFVVTRNRDAEVQTWVRRDERSDWQLLNTGELADVDISPLRFSANGRAYVSSNEKDGRDCLFEQDLASGDKRELSCDAVADLGNVVFSFDRREPIAAFYQPDKPRIQYLSEHPDRVLLEKIQNSFPGEIAVPISATRDGRQLILVVYSDRDPGRYFLFDRDSEKATFLLSAHAWADAKTMAERRPITYAARDGAPLHGYLTLPPGQPEKALPLVMLPHGGPFGLRDDWSWDQQAQWLAANGYAVLQVNFRGSGGYGRDHLEAGQQGWDTVMIDDLTDGTRWAIDQGIADPDRVAIFGASYGGYAALMSAVREPELYRCVVDYAGVSDLKAFSEDSDVADSQAGRNFIDRFIGSSSARLKAASPLTMIDRLKAPVFIVHGEEDVRVPFSQATALRKALDRRQHPYQWMAKKGEGHGFAKPENREEFLTRLVAFLDQHLKAADITAAR